MRFKNKDEVGLREFTLNKRKGKEKHSKHLYIYIKKKFNINYLSTVIIQPIFTRFPLLNKDFYSFFKIFMFSLQYLAKLLKLEY